MNEIRPKPEVKELCKRCEKIWPAKDPARLEVVSPTGVAHHGAPYGETACGMDATGDDWWWPL